MAFVLLLSATFLAAACNNANESRRGAGEDSAEAPPPEDVVSGVGTVRHVDLEGGFYGIVADDSTHYNPQHLEAKYRQDGLRVRFRAVKKKDVMTTQMWGEPVEMLKLMRLDEQ